MTYALDRCVQEHLHESTTSANLDDRLLSLYHDAMAHEHSMMGDAQWAASAQLWSSQSRIFLHGLAA
jgi:hypothetical protein